MKSKYEIFIDTDVFEDELQNGTKTLNNLFSRCKDLFVCYTSVVNASEIFSLYSDRSKLTKAKNSFEGVNILGIPFRYSLKIGEILRLIKKKILTIITGTRLSWQCALRQGCLCCR